MDQQDLGTRAPSRAERQRIRLDANALYMVRILITAKDSPFPPTVDIELQYCRHVEPDRFVVIRSHELAIPVVPQEESRGFIGQPWYEQTIFVRGGDFVNVLSIEYPVVEAFDVSVRHSRMAITWHGTSKLPELLETLDSKTVDWDGQVCRPFFGVDDALEYLGELTASAGRIKPPHLSDCLPPPVGAERLTVGVVGDAVLIGLLGTHVDCVELTPSTIALVESNALDAVVLQRRATSVQPEHATIVEAERFWVRLADALAVTAVPVMELAPLVDDETSHADSLVLINGEHCDVPSASVSEFELCRFSPLRTDTWHARSILVPVASDLYQDPGFRSQIVALVSGGFHVTVCELSYAHVPVRTWEMFGSSAVKVYGRVSLNQFSELCNSCGFVIFPRESLRNVRELYDLAGVAIFSGAIPVVIGNPLAPPFDDLVKTAVGETELFDFLTTYSFPITRERRWLALFRELSRRVRSSEFLPFLRSATGTANLSSGEPSAEIVCVSKRPSRIQDIVDNFKRQNYSDLGLHIIWNVEQERAGLCEDISRRYAQDRVRVSFLNKTHNIGSCLNHGIMRSSADYWFKMDDDDYYGSRYVEDMLNWYWATGADSVGKPQGFVSFSDGSLYLREVGTEKMRRRVPSGQFVSGASLSGKVADKGLLFSGVYRNSCDSEWVKALHANQMYVVAADVFNVVVRRDDGRGHTWQISDDILKERSRFISPTWDSVFVDAL